MSKGKFWASDGFPRLYSKKPAGGNPFEYAPVVRRRHSVVELDENEQEIRSKGYERNEEDLTWPQVALKILELLTVCSLLIHCPFKIVVMMFLSTISDAEKFFKAIKTPGLTVLKFQFIIALHLLILRLITKYFLFKTSIDSILKFFDYKKIGNEQNIEEIAFDVIFAFNSVLIKFN